MVFWGGMCTYVGPPCRCLHLLGADARGRGDRESWGVEGGVFHHSCGTFKSVRLTIGKSAMFGLRWNLHRPTQSQVAS